MKQTLAKILLCLIIISCVTSCNVVKRVGENEHLLTKATVTVNGKRNNKEDITNLLYQTPNVKALGIPLRLHIYNLARPNRDSLFEVWIDKKPKRRAHLKNLYSQKQVDVLKESALGLNSWLKKTGEAPAIVDTVKTNKSKKNLEDYYFVNGWFDRVVIYNISKSENQRAAINYNVITGNPYFLDSISAKISSPIIDSLYHNINSGSLIKKGNQFKAYDFSNERERLTSSFRNSGVYHFSQDYIRFENDTLGKAGR